MQEQSCLFGDGGRVSEAFQSAPVAGQSRALVLVGVYEAELVPVGLIDASRVFRLL